MSTIFIQHGRSIGAFFGISFVLHLLWENLQAPLFEGYQSFTQHFWMCFRGALGDLIFMIVIYAVLAVVHRNLFWVADPAAYARFSTWVITIALGVAMAVAFEWWALGTGRWSYADGMPLLPGLGVGLVPVLQMFVIPPFTLFSIRSIPTHL